MDTIGISRMRRAAMLGMIFLIVMLVVVVGSFMLIGIRTAKNPDNFLRRHPGFAKFILLAYIVFAGCFVFPIGSNPYPFNLSKLYLLTASYGIIGLGFAGLYGDSKEKFVYPATLVLTIAGMLCRYLIEYGEVSNTYNFTTVNVISYLVMIPLFTVAAYSLIVKYLTHVK